MSNSMYGMYSPFNQQYGGMGGGQQTPSMWGGGYPEYNWMLQNSYQTPGGFGGLWGGYNPYGQQGGYGGGYGYNQQPNYGYMGYQPQQQFGGFFDQFDTRMNDLFQKYFSANSSGATTGGESGNTTPPAGGTTDGATAPAAGPAPSSTPAPKPGFTPVRGAGQQQYRDQGYKNRRDFLNKNPNAAMDYAIAHPVSAGEDPKKNNPYL